MDSRIPVKHVSQGARSILSSEWPVIVDMATIYGVDPAIIAAIRLAEGSQKYPFGIKSVFAPSYIQQLRISCVTVAKRISMYEKTGKPAHEIASLGPRRRLRLTSNFLAYLGSSYAPTTGVPAEEARLNKNWVPNVTKLYNAIVLSLCELPDASHPTKSPREEGVRS